MKCSVTICVNLVFYLQLNLLKDTEMLLFFIKTVVIHPHLVIFDWSFIICIYQTYSGCHHCMVWSWLCLWKSLCCNPCSPCFALSFSSVPMSSTIQGYWGKNNTFEWWDLMILFSLSNKIDVFFFFLKYVFYKRNMFKPWKRVMKQARKSQIELKSRGD